MCSGASGCGSSTEAGAACAASRAIAEQKRQDEAEHALQAEQAGAAPLPAPVRSLMRVAARVMTGTAHYL